MTWARLEDSFPDHPKVAALSDAEFRLHVTAICYASRYNTDGAIPAAALRSLRGTPKLAAKLVLTGVWEEEGDGWRVHDFLDYNPSRDEAAAKRLSREQAGRLGGLRSGVTRRSKTEANASPEPGSTTEADASRLLRSKSNPDPSPLLLTKQTSRAQPRDGGDESFQQAIAALTRIKVRLLPIVADEVGMMLDEGTKPEWFEAAAAIAGRNGASSWGYVRRILQGWGEDGPPAPYATSKAATPPPQQERIPTAEEVFEQIRNRPAVPVPDELEYLRANDPEAYERELARRERSRARLAAHMAANGQAT